MRVLVVGASGFLGRATCRRLQRVGHSVVGTWRSHRERLPEGLADSFAESDLETRAVDVEAVVLCSALIPHGSMTRPDPALSEANIALPLRVSRRFRNQRVVLTSSVAVYGAAESPRTEASPFVMPDEYGWTKIAAEAVIRQHPSFGIIRFSSLYGPGMRPATFIPAIVDSARRQHRIVLFGDGARTQDYLHVDDAARLIEIVAGLKENATFLGASGSAVSNLEVATIVAKAMPGTEIRHEGADATPSTAYDVRISKKGTGFIPAIPLQEGIRSMVNA